MNRHQRLKRLSETLPKIRMRSLLHRRSRISKSNHMNHLNAVRQIFQLCGIGNFFDFLIHHDKSVIISLQNLAKCLFPKRYMFLVQKAAMFFFSSKERNLHIVKWRHSTQMKCIIIIHFRVYIFTWMCDSVSCVKSPYLCRSLDHLQSNTNKQKSAKKKVQK